LEIPEIDLSGMDLSRRSARPAADLIAAGITRYAGNSFHLTRICMKRSPEILGFQSPADRTRLWSFIRAEKNLCEFFAALTTLEF
jgi:hypothetical protein